MTSVSWSMPEEQPPGRGASPEEVARYIEDLLWGEFLCEMPRDQQLTALQRWCATNQWSWAEVVACLSDGPWAELAVGDSPPSVGEDRDTSQRSAPRHVVTQLHGDGCHPLDVADQVGRTGGAPGQLAGAMAQARYSELEIVAAVKHLIAPCPHEGAEDIGTLPEYPERRVPLDGSSRRDIRSTADDAWDAIKAANDPEQFFDHGGVPVWVKARPQFPAATEPITVPRMLHLVGEVGYWEREAKGDSVPCRPPKAVAEHMVADPRRRLPYLRRLVRVPVFDSCGHLVMQPGYHETSHLFLACRGLQIARVFHAPTKAEITSARSLLYELVEDFPFVAEADRTNAIAFALLPYVRDLIPGPTPLHVFTKPYPGSGATLLVQALYYPAIGQRAAMQSMPTSEVEAEYRMTATLLASPDLVVYDNVRETLDCGQLANAITNARWEGRQVKTSNLLSLPITNAWAVTGNNLKVSDEIARRAVPIRLDPHTDKPFERTGFRHPNLIAWADEHRSELVQANLTLVQAWVAEGMPRGSLVVGMFEDWAGVMSGVADVVGLPDLRANWGDWNESRPSDSNLIRKVVAAWCSELGDRQVKAKDLLPIIGPLLDIDPAGERASETALGIRLRGWQGRVVDGFEIVGNDVSGSRSWRLVRR